MSRSESSIVYSVRLLAGNGKLERLLNQLIDRLAADHRGTESHSRKNILNRLREQLIGGLKHLELTHVGFATAQHHKLCLNLSSDAGALQYRRVFRLRTVLQHLRGLLDLELEIGLVRVGYSTDDAGSGSAFHTLAAEVAFVGD